MNARILIVDDEEDILDLMEAHLVSAGHAVEKTTSPVHALQCAKNGMADLVLTDMQLPQMSGLELLKQIKLVSPGLPVILVSGQATDMSKDRAKELGAYDFMDKPVKKEELLECVKKALEEHWKTVSVLKLLVADDHADVRRFFSDVLRSDAYAIRFAEDGKQAVDKVLRESFDMVFMDIHMPNKNGIEAAKEIKEKKPGTFVVMMTGEAEEDEIKKALSLCAGYDAVLRKPFQVATLRLMVQNLVKEKENYLKKLAEEERLAQRGAAEVLRDEIVEEGKEIAGAVKSRKFKQWAFVVIISLVMSLVIINIFLPLTEIAGKAPQTITNWMNHMEGYMQRDEQRELNGNK